MNIIARTPQFIIRPYQPEDEAAHLAMFADPLVNVHLPNRTEEQNRKLFMESMQVPQEPFNRWSIIGADGEYLGMCMLRRAKEDDDSVLNIGYSLPYQHWGKGIAKSVVSVLSAYGFSFPSTQKITAITTTDNTPSQIVLLRNGFEQCGTADDNGVPLLCFEKCSE